MTDPAKTRRKVASRIYTTPTSSPVPTVNSASGLKPTLRARVTPNAIATPSTSEKSALRSTPSSSSLTSHVSTTPSSVSRARSPIPPNVSSHGSKSMIGVRTPHRLPLVASNFHSRSAGTTSAGPSSTSGTPIARVRAAKSSIDAGGIQTPEAQIRRSAADKAASGSQLASRARAHSLRSTVDASSGSGDRRDVAKSKSSFTSPNQSWPDTAPTSRSPLSPPKPKFRSDKATGLGVDGAHLSPTPWMRDPSPERSSSPSHPQQISLERTPSGESRTYAQHAQHRLLHVIHPTSSAPTSPTPHSGPNLVTALADPPRSAARPHVSSRTKLPLNPQSIIIPTLPSAPGSPEVKPIELPVMTPVQGPESDFDLSSKERDNTSGKKWSMRSPALLFSEEESEGEVGAFLEGKEPFEPHSEIATSLRHLQNNEAMEERKIGDMEMDDMLVGDAEEAKVNRKIADLEISNASLLAINKSLEATKSKQRTEIFKLRRRLRETLSRPSFPHSIPSSPPFPALYHKSLSPVTSPGRSGIGLGINDGEGDDDLDVYHDNEMADPQLDARWDKISGLLQMMRTRAESAVDVGKEETKTGGSRVLGWLEMEEKDKENGLEERDVSIDMDMDVSVGSVAGAMLVADGDERDKIEGGDVEHQFNRLTS